MRAMKDSGIEWIGQIPQEWDIVKIKHIIDDNEFGIKIGPFGSALTNRKKSAGSINVYSQANIISGSFASATHTIDEGSFDELKGYEVKPGDVCVSMMGTIGKCCVVPDTISTGIMDSHLIKIRLNEDVVDNQFFAYVYDKDGGGICFSQIQHDKRGTIMDGLNTAIVRNLVFPLPPLACQKRISTYLNTKCAEIDALIAAKEKTNALLKERRQSIIYEAVTKGLNPDAPMKDSGVEWIGEIPEEWETRRIKYCFDVFAGATPKSGNSEFWDGDVVWVTPADYTTEQKYITQGRKYITQEGFESCSTEMIPAGSLIFSKRAPIGLVAINMVELCTNQGCLSCVPKDGNDVEYFYYAFSCFAEQFDLYGSGTTFKEISADAFVNFPIPFPSTEEQKEISEHLRIKCSELDTLISANEATIQKLKEYRQSIIYEAVTGKIEV